MVSSGIDDPGDLQVSLDGKVLTTLEVERTGLWGRYKTVSAAAVGVTGGRNRTLRLTLVNGGSVNYDYVTFIRTGDLETK